MQITFDFVDYILFGYHIELSFKLILISLLFFSILLFLIKILIFLILFLLIFS